MLRVFSISRGALFLVYFYYAMPSLLFINATIGRDGASLIAVLCLYEPVSFGKAFNSYKASRAWRGLNSSGFIARSFAARSLWVFGNLS